LGEAARPGPDVLIGHDVAVSTDLARQLDGVAAADLQATVLVEAAAQGIYVRELARRGHGVGLSPSWSANARSRATSSWDATAAWPTRCGCPRGRRWAR